MLTVRSKSKPMETLPFVIGFSGNRPANTDGRLPWQIEAMRERIAVALAEVGTYAMREGLATGGRGIGLCSSVAEGADTIACEIAMERALMLDVVLPKGLESFQADFKDSTVEAWRRVSAVLEYAASGVNGSRLRIADRAQGQDACYVLANRMILDTADAFVVLWDGVRTGLRGGTAEVLDAVRAKGLPCILLNTLEPDSVERTGFLRQCGS